MVDDSVLFCVCVTFSGANYLPCVLILRDNVLFQIQTHKRFEWTLNIQRANLLGNPLSQATKKQLNHRLTMKNENVGYLSAFVCGMLVSSVWNNVGMTGQTQMFLYAKALMMIMMTMVMIMRITACRLIERSVSVYESHS